MRRLFVLFICCAAVATAQIQTSGSITDHIDSIITVIPSTTGTNEYQTPDASERSLWKGIIQSMLDGDYSGAHASAGSIGYRVVTLEDTTNSATYQVLEKTAAGTQYWGTFVLNPDPERSRLFVQAPHPLHDGNTGNQSILVFKNIGAKAFIVSGTHRCNSSSYSSCDGTTSVCSGSSEPFRKSDQAHNNDGTFYVTTELFKSRVPGMIVLQLHGFAQGIGDPDFILGNGTQSTPVKDWLLVLKDNLLEVDAGFTFKVAHIDTEWTELTGTTNTEGRLVNNSANPCEDAAGVPTGRFLHVEQAYTGIRENATQWEFMATALTNTFPPDNQLSSIASGNWSSTSTWDGNIIPNDTIHVVIGTGHTVTVDNASAESNSLTFQSSTSHLAFSTGSTLSIYGDLSLFDETHQAFSLWNAGAKLMFAGDQDQTLIGWNRDSTNFSSTIMEMQVNKSAGTLATAGNDMNFNLGDTLDIISGTFRLTAGDDIEGRSLDGSSPTTPAFVVRSGGTFVIEGDSSYIRSGTTDTIALGPLTNYGTVQLNGTDLNLGYNFSDFYNRGGGTIEVYSGWATSRLFRVDTLLIESGSIFQTSTSSNILTSAGRTVLNAGGTYKILSSTVNFSTSFTNNGTVEYAATGDQTISRKSYKKLKLSGSGTKTLTMTAGLTSDTLEIADNASLVLNSASSYSLTIPKLLTLAGGSITTNEDSVVLGQSASIVGEIQRTAGTVVGNFKRWISASTQSGLLFPVGNDSYYRPLSLSFTSAPSVGGTLTAHCISSDPGSSGLPLDDIGTSIIQAAPDGYWTLNAGNGLTGGTYSLNVTAAGFAGISDYSTLRILKRTNGGNWLLDGSHVIATGSNENPIVSRSGMSGFSEFGIGGGGDNALPVELAYFRIARSSDCIFLTWSTNTEINNAGFEIERNAPRIPHSMNGDMSGWVKIGFVEGSGTSNTPKEYTFVDRTAAGNAKYRLKQIDRDGYARFSHSVEVAVTDDPESTFILRNYPNPFNPSTVITYAVPQDGTVVLTIHNSIGQEIVSLTRNDAQSGQLYDVPFDASRFGSGVFFATVRSGNLHISRRMILIR